VGEEATRFRNVGVDVLRSDVLPSSGAPSFGGSMLRLSTTSSERTDATTRGAHNADVSRQEERPAGPCPSLHGPSQHQCRREVDTRGARAGGEGFVGHVSDTMHRAGTARVTFMNFPLATRRAR
jgi:hypothetical protein